MAITTNHGPDAGKIEHVGCVLHVGRRTVQIMSDVWEDEVYADIWDGQKVISPGLHASYYLYTDGTTGYEWQQGGQWQQAYKHASIDATPEVIAAAAEWRRVNELIRFTDAECRRATQIEAGKLVKVISGRKVPIGSTHVVARTGRSDYGTYAHLKGAQPGELITYIDFVNLRVLNPADYIAADQELACCTCRRTGTKAELELRCSGRCRTCDVEAIMEGNGMIALPDGSYRPYHDAFRGPIDSDVWRGVHPDDRGIIEQLHADNQDRDLWNIWCDKLEERCDPRAAELREALNGPAKKKRARKTKSPA